MSQSTSSPGSERARLESEALRQLHRSQQNGNLRLS